MERACWALLLIGALRCWPVAAQQQECTPDPLLTEAAAELLLAHDERPSAHALGAAVRTAGSDAVGVHALFVPVGAVKDSEQKWLASLRTRVDGALCCGRADNAAGRLLVAFGRGAELQPIDERARIVRGQLQAGFRDAELVIETADAQLIRVGVSDASLRKGVELAPDLSLPVKVQLVARGPTGPRPVAEREVQARPASLDDNATPPTRELGQRRDVRGSGPSSVSAMRASTSPSVKPAAGSGTDADGGAEELSRLLLGLRRERGRGALRANRLLREAASQHAQEVCAKGRVAHELEAGIGPDTRLARAGLDARVLGEAIARAEGSISALEALKNSPSHLFTLLDPRFTDFGIGVAQDSTQKYCYVVLLCAWPRFIGKRR